MCKSSTVSEFPIQAGLAKLAACAIGICSCYLFYGFLQERFFKENIVGATFLLVTQCISNTIVALVWQRMEGFYDRSVRKRGKLHHPLLLLTSICYVAAMTSSNSSMRFVSYPTAVLAKSCKLIPTMVMGLLIERKCYSSTEWLAAICITSGIVLFNISRLTTSNDDRENSSYGLFLLLVSLIFDGLLGSCQGLLKRVDKLKQRPPTAVETMLYVNLYALLWLTPMAHYSGEWDHGMAHFQTVKAGVMWLNLAAAAGQIFIFLTITWFSPLICTTITTTRKFFTILLSVLHFGHVFTNSQWASVGLVFGGLFVGIQSKANIAGTATTKEE